MKITIEFDEEAGGHTASVYYPGEVDIHEALQAFKGALLGAGYQPESYEDAIVEEALQIGVDKQCASL